MTLQEKLGYPENTKLLIIHADDAGLCHSENMATIQALLHGQVNSYSIMVPCPGFNEMAEYAKNHPEFDLGIHLTLTCEWQNFKWSPVLPWYQVPSLTDQLGFFYKEKEQVKNYAKASEIKSELRAQIEKALEVGLKPTHLDSHMYTLALKEEFLQVYKDLGSEYGLPVFLSEQFLKHFGLKTTEIISDKDLLITNDIVIGDYSVFEKGNLIEYYADQLENLPKGLNIFILHPAFDTDEMKNITIDHPNFGSHWRQLDVDFITSKACKEILDRNKIQLITWREIRDKSC